MARAAQLVGLLAGSLASLALGDVVVNFAPSSGVSRSSQLWIDPSGNDLDSDAVCWQVFQLAQPTAITRLEWWGAGACELGFRVEVWPQDPGTIAVQPLGVFYYGYNGQGQPPVQPTYRIETSNIQQSPGPSGLVHYTLDLPAPWTLDANSSANPRWFLSVIGFTNVAFATWNWGGTSATTSGGYWWIRGNHMFYRLGDGRAMTLTGTPLTPACQANCDGSTLAPILNALDFSCFLNRYVAGDPYANCDGSTVAPVLNTLDFSCFLNRYVAGCP